MKRLAQMGPGRSHVSLALFLQPLAQHLALKANCLNLAGWSSEDQGLRNLAGSQPILAEGEFFEQKGLRRCTLGMVLSTLEL